MVFSTVSGKTYQFFDHTRKYALPENTMTFVIIHGAIPVPEEMCPKELNYEGFTSWFNSGDAKGDEYNCFADQEGIVCKCYDSFQES